MAHILLTRCGKTQILTDTAISMVRHVQQIYPFLIVILMDVFLISSVVPLLRDSVGILMQRTPKDLDLALPGCYQRVSLHSVWLKL